MYRQANKKYGRPKNNTAVSKKFKELGFTEDGNAGCCGSKNDLHFYKKTDSATLCVWFGVKPALHNAEFYVEETGKDVEVLQKGYLTWTELFEHIRENDF